MTILEPQQARLFWSTVPDVLNRTVLIATAALTAKVFWLNRIPEPIPGLQTMGFVVEGILGSAIASYVFYLLTIHLKEVSDKLNIYPFVLHSCRSIVGDCNDLLGEISKTVQKPLTLQDLNEAVLKELLLPVAFQDHTTAITMAGRPADWYDYHSYIRNRSHEQIATALVQAPFVESRLISLLIRIDECTYFLYGEGFPRRPRNDGGKSMMHTISRPIADYCGLCRELSTLIDELAIWDKAKVA